MSFMKIKKTLFFIQFVVMSSTFIVFAQQEQQKEYVQVVNAELILRVLKDGSPVGGLKKSDFSLFEDGQKTEINGFFENHRRIAPASESQKQTQKPRLYLLFFWVDNPKADVEGVLNKFFSSIYREGDRVILSTPFKTFELTTQQEIAGITAAFLEQWRQEAKNGLAKRLQFSGDLNRMFEDFVNKMVDKVKSDNVKNFLVQYAAAIREYQILELSPDLAAFDAMARSLLPVENDKFALVFFQHDTLPLFDINNVKAYCLLNKDLESIANLLAYEISKIELQAKLFFDIRSFSEKLKSLFVQANTQFHLLFLNPDKSEGQTSAISTLPLTKNEEIFSNWDQVMQEISKNTGGLRLDGNHMVDALDQVASFEDIYYHITYVPREQGTKKRKIDIRVNQPGMQVIHGRMLEMKDIPSVKINEISASSQFIRLTVADFYSIPKDGVPTGLLKIYVTGSQGENEPSRLLLAKASETDGTIELPFAFPQPGAWNLQVRVIDQITGQQAVKEVKVEIAAAITASTTDSDPDPALIALLAQASLYAEKLKKAAFHFVCREEVAEDKFAVGIECNGIPFSERTNWLYDYQIIGQDAKIAENRVLLQKNRTKLRQEKAQLETRFRSLYSFYMPVTFLAREKQHFYYYRLLDKKKVKKKPAWHIGAIRRDSSLSIPCGEMWVSENDGAVLKIQVEQTSIIGFEELAQKAIKRALVPAITIIHEYDIEKNQIRFPSKTTFIERYNSDKKPLEKWGKHQEMSIMVSGHFSFERSRTYFEYKDYRFFSITTSVEEKNE